MWDGEKKQFDVMICEGKEKQETNRSWSVVTLDLDMIWFKSINTSPFPFSEWMCFHSPGLK